MNWSLGLKFGIRNINGNNPLAMALVDVPFCRGSL